MKRILLVNGSPHSSGNTASVLYRMEEVFRENGFETKRFEIGASPVRGCIGCDRCEKTNRCIFKDDLCNDLMDEMEQADGIVLGSPVYFAGPSGALCALLDRVFYAGAEHGRLFAGKPGTAVVTAWREGGTAALDRLNKYFAFAEMPIISGSYWNAVIGPAEDAFGINAVRTTAENMCRFLQK